MITALVLALGLAAPPLQGPATGTVRGTVRGAGDAPLAGAAVALQGGAPRVAHTDSAGGYRLRAVPAGRRTLRAWRPDHEPFEVEVEVPAGGEVVVDLSLRPRSIPLAGIQVRGSGATPGEPGAEPTDSVGAPAAALQVTGMRGMESTPALAEVGLGARPRGSPGQAPADPSDVLYVRGSSAELKLVLLDGAPVYTPFHLGGLLDSFEGETLGGARLFLGGAPARYDGGLAYILDLSTRAGREGRPRTSGSVDLLSARATVEGSATGRARYLLGGRAIHQWGLAPLLGGRLPYGYGDALARVDVRLGEEQALSLTGFHNRETARLDSAAARSGDVEWGNTALSLRYRGRLGGTTSDVAVAWSGFEARLPVGARPGVPTTGASRRLRATADFARAAGPLRVGYGASFDRTSLRSDVPVPLRSWGVPGERVAEGDVGGAYLDASWQPHARLRLRGGLRGDLFSEDPAPRVSPRMSATWLLTEAAALSLAGGRYHQYVRAWAPVQSPDPRTPGPDTLYVPAGLAVGRASHLSLALHQRLDPALWLGVEGFFKSFQGIEAPGAARANASGVDLWVRREEGRVRGWLGYSLSWVWSAAAPGRSGERFEGRQALTAALAGTLGRWGEADVRVAYGAGLPFTAIPMEVSAPEGIDFRAPANLGSTTRGAVEAAPLPVAPDDSYLRLDFGITRTFTPRWQGVRTSVSPYLRVLNALSRRDALFYHYRHGDDAGPRPLAALPLLPLLGVSWRF